MSTRKPIEPLSAPELESLILAARPESASGCRARALVSLLAYAGLRVSEAVAVEVRDLDLAAGVVNVRRGKGGRQRQAALLREGESHVVRWLARRERLGLAGPLLCTLGGGPLDRSYVWRLLRRLAVRAGIEKRVHPHGLRHSHAHLLALRGHIITDLRDQLGHSSLKTTDLYLSRFSGADRIKRLRS